MWKYQCHCAQQPSLLHSVCSIQRCRAAAHCSRSHCTDHVRRDAVSASGSGEEPYTRRVSTNGENYANIEEIIADGGFGFHWSKVKVSFLKPEKVNMLIFLWKNAITVTDSQFCFAFLCFHFKKLIFAVYLTLRLSFTYLFVLLSVC